MDFARYRKRLSTLPLLHPRPEDMAALCPHLSPDEAVAAFKSGARVGRPPLKATGAFPTLKFYPGWVDDAEGVVYPPCIDHSVGHFENPCAARALAFAQEHWGDRLMTHSSSMERLAEFRILEPVGSNLQEPALEHPRLLFTLGVSLVEDWVNLSSRCDLTPEMVDRAILEMTVDPLEWEELLGGAGSFVQLNCARCGHYLSDEGCLGCKQYFALPRVPSGGTLPLSPKMVAYVQSNKGHTFPQDPLLAWSRRACQSHSIRA